MVFELEIRTMVLILGVTHLMQVIVFYHQYLVNKRYQGVGWWLLWSAAEVIGFCFILFRNTTVLLPLVIIIQNFMIVAGTVFLYVGVKQFFYKKVNLRIIIPIVSVFIIGLLYFLFIDNDIQIRSVIINGTITVLAFMTAYSLFVDKTPSIAASANFNGLIFVVHGALFTYRTITIFQGAPVISFLTPTFFNYIPFLDALVVSLLWTFGFIIMLNNRLHVEMSEAQDDLHQIFNTSPDAAIIARLDDGTIADINNGCTAITGYTREDLLGKSILDAKIWKNLEDRKNLIRILKEKYYCENFEAQFIRKDGVEITGLLSAKIINLQGIPHIISISRDISGRKRMERALRESNDYLESLINYANAPIIVWDPLSRITRFNHAFEFLTGYSESEVTGKSLEMLFPPALAQYSMNLIRKTLTGERWESVEIMILHRDQSIRTVLWNSATLFAPDGITPVATIAQGQEITKRKEAEKEIQLKNDELQKVIAEKDKFFSILAHDLRSPFNAFLGFTQVMAEDLSSMTLEEIHKIAVTMRKSATSLYSLLENLLEWSKVQRGVIVFTPEPISFRSAVLKSLDPVVESATSKEISIHFDIGENTMVFADPHMLQTLMRNLVSNAIKYTPRGGFITISSRNLPDHLLEISVKDTGIGISKDMQANIFRLDPSTNRPGTNGEPSTGLGLIICKEFVEKHNGNIWVDSEEGRGSTFHLTLKQNNLDRNTCL